MAWSRFQQTVAYGMLQTIKEYASGTPTHRRPPLRGLYTTQPLSMSCTPPRIPIPETRKSRKKWWFQPFFCVCDNCRRSFRHLSSAKVDAKIKSTTLCLRNFYFYYFYFFGFILGIKKNSSSADKSGCSLPGHESSPLRSRRMLCMTQTNRPSGVGQAHIFTGRTIVFCNV